MLVLTREKSKRVRIGDDITVTVVEIRGSRVRLGFDAPKDMPVHREEIWLNIQKENRDDASE